MEKPYYIIDEVLTPLLDGCKTSFRDGTLYLDLDDDIYMLDISLDNNGIFDCAVWGASKEFDLTKRQKDFIYLKVLHAYDDEVKKIKENGESILN